MCFFKKKKEDDVFDDLDAFGRKHKTIENNNDVLENTSTPSPININQSDFYMVVEDVFHVSGRGVVACGMVQGGIVSVGDIVEIVSEYKAPIVTKIAGLQQFRKTCTVANIRDNVGILFSGINKDNIQRGDVVRLIQTLKD